MRLPHLFLDRLCFNFATGEELIRALGDTIKDGEAEAITRLCEINLPPVTSARCLATMIGVNERLIWSMQNRQHKYYRNFSIAKGNGLRQISAPKVSLKIIQKWLSVRLSAIYNRPSHVFGFHPGLSHIDAARCHLGCRWVYSVDISNFFPSTSEILVAEELNELGYDRTGAQLIARLSSLNGFLAQGSPASPILSNIVFRNFDSLIAELAQRLDLNVSRYADDIVFSGDGDYPDDLADLVDTIFVGGPWTLSKEKKELALSPSRLKVHGLLVHGKDLRLTKSYRNKIRGYKFALEKGNVKPEDIARLRGHLSYAASVETRAKPEITN